MPPTARRLIASVVPQCKTLSPSVQIRTFASQQQQQPDKEPEYDLTDISTLGHYELAQHRELREMIRVAAWDMPLLSSLAKPFERDPSHFLRWRYTTYMGEAHPGAAKVVVEFRPDELPGLNKDELHALLLIAAQRYNPVKGVIKMSSDTYPEAAQNKRYLGDTIGKLIAEAKANAEKFKDMPLDTRHVRKPKYVKRRFPEHWRLTEQRREQLLAERKEQELEEGKRVDHSRIVGGLSEQLVKLPDVSREPDVVKETRREESKEAVLLKRRK